ncbi:MAG: CinA family protein [Paracoccaceae bacterium]|nr:CinA family protein [Paracoccaceae bacterium]
MTDPESLLAEARALGVMITTAESCTGGMVAARLTDIPGSSDVFERGFVTYSNAAKTQMLGVPPTLIDKHGAVSEDVAHAMATGALQHSMASLAVSITGVAGPGGSEHKPEGMVCFGLATAADVITETRQFGPLGRANVRSESVEHALNLLAKGLRRLQN